MGNGFSSHFYPSATLSLHRKERGGKKRKGEKSRFRSPFSFLFAQRRPLTRKRTFCSAPDFLLFQRRGGSGAPTIGVSLTLSAPISLPPF